jgi:citrate lyase subunit beta/citryl-CoA lyase
VNGATWLFVPGDRPDRFAKAAAAGADEIILDLEDAVVPASKPAARDAAVAWLSAAGSAWVRVNAPTTSWYDADVTALLSCPGVRGLVVPKAEDPEPLAELGRRLRPGQRLVALVETARGVADVRAVAACPAVSRLAFGAIDFALDIDAQEDDTSLLLARSSLVLASRVAGIAPPLDGVTTDVADPSAAGADARRARALGFGGKLCIHPSQIEPVGREFRPTQADVAWARAVLSGAGAAAGASTGSDGHMIDKPVRDRARRILERAGEGPDAAA